MDAFDDWWSRWGLASLGIIGLIGVVVFLVVGLVDARKIDR